MSKMSSVEGVSYIGNPKSNTAMYITKKVEYLLDNLLNVENCCIFAENGIKVNPAMQRRNQFFFSDNPQIAYARFVNKIYSLRCEEERRKKYTLHANGYYIGENAVIGDDAYIEPGCLIGHDVIIGDHAVVLYGSVIKNSIIGSYFHANEYAVIGSMGFTMAEDENKNKFRIPTMGKVVIGNHVEIGAHNNISCGIGGDTVIEDYVKLDALVYIGHDVHLGKNVEITAGNILAGFAELNENVYLGINSSIRNRITLRENCVVGMGANVTRDVPAHATVVGNPAKPLQS